jgi:putrescine aminotransferase
MRHGLILRLIGDRVVFAPPLVIEEDDIGEIGVRLRRALDEVANELKTATAAG